MKYSIFKRLSNQAAASVTSGLRGCDWQLEYDKIFAELIVQECAAVCDRVYFDRYPDAEDYERSEEGEAILEHF